MLRKCTYRIWVPAIYSESNKGAKYVIEGTCCYSEPLPGLFHQWGLDIMEGTSGFASFSVALVETKKNEIVKVLPEHIKFIS